MYGPIRDHNGQTYFLNLCARSASNHTCRGTYLSFLLCVLFYLFSYFVSVLSLSLSLSLYCKYIYILHIYEKLFVFPVCSLCSNWFRCVFCVCSLPNRRDGTRRTGVCMSVDDIGLFCRTW